MHDDDRNATRQRYSDRFREYGYDPRALGWNKGRQPVRFDRAVAGLELNSDLSILDVGCGFGDLCGFLRARGWSGRYVGVDIVPELLDEGRVRFADRDAEFILADLSAQDAGDTKVPACDYVISLGVFNHHNTHQHDQFVHAMLEAMWRHSKVAVVADFLSSTADRQRQDLHFANAGEMLNWALTHTKRAVVDHSYMPFEFLLKMWRDDCFEADAPVFAPFLPLISA